ncbi:MAG: UDP-glucose 4-epimerase GalE [Deltaproteobacteria bacterium]|jgi:UDP-glucose-4-epimerase GalE|nr:UDP-glucose 4-epimerase GalE [Deltaproteobacteria bacterium]
MSGVKKVLVTGGAGYIGAHACKALAEAGYTPVVYDNLFSGHRDFIRWGEFIHGDILDARTLRAAMRRTAPLGVMHFAARIEVGESVRDPGLFYRVNAGGVLTLLESMRDEGVNCLVLSGTCAVYGTPERSPVSEDAPLRPISPYAASKAMMERMLDDFEAAHGLRGAVLRYFNAAGADPGGEIGERHRPESHLIPRVFMAACGDTPALALYGDDYATPDGTCLRDYIHVNDLARAHVLALEKLLQGGRGFKINLGTGRGYSVREVLEKSRAVLGRDIPFSILPRRPGDSPALVGEVALAKRALGWRAEHSSLEHILHTAWEWFKKDRPNRG